MRQPVFRSRRVATSAAATVGMLAALEIADSMAPSRPEDEIRDERTIELFGAAMVAAIGGSVATLARQRPLPRRRGPWWTGVALIWGGGALNRLARRRLGANYRSRVTIVPGHQIVRGGPYRCVRHPMYSGVAMICSGAAVAVASPASGVWVLPILALLRRIEVEEATLATALGTAYEEYSQDRHRLVPGVW